MKSDISFSLYAVSIMLGFSRRLLLLLLPLALPPESSCEPWFALGQTEAQKRAERNWPLPWAQKLTGISFSARDWAVRPGQ